MATAKIEHEEITKCPICLETYRKPKYLPCLHTFCETCLSEYITSSFKSSPLNTNVSQAKEFPCPICRVPVIISDSTSTAPPTPENIASKLPANHLIVTLLDQGRLKLQDKPCDPCLILEERTGAVSWCTSCNEALCKTCERCHRTMKVSRNHKICPLEEIQAEPKSLTSLEMCENHEDECIKFYCMDHKQPCCSVCVTVHHRKCEHVKTLTDAAKGIQESPELKELSESFKPMIEELTSILEGRKRNLKLLDKAKQDQNDKITKMNQEIKKHLELLEENLDMELNGCYKECSMLINNDIYEIESSLKIMANCQKMLGAVLKNVSDIHAFLEMNKIKQKQLELSNTLNKRLSELKEHNIELCFEDSWLNLQSNLTKIGTVNSTSIPVKTNKRIFGEKGKKNLQSCVAKSIRSFTVGQFLSAGMFLQNDNLLLVDCFGKKVIICTIQGQVQKELSLPGNPWDIARISDTEIVVLLEDTQNIQYIDIVNFTLGKLITVNKRLYRGIGYDGTNLVVGATDKSLCVIDRNGTILKTLSTTSYKTEYIACNAKRICYTLGSGNKLICLDTTGWQIFRYTCTDLSGIEGISFDNEGNIYCCGFDSKNVHQITSDGKLIKPILTDITRPCGIAFDNSRERFLVTHNRNKVTIYELSNP